jgi:hypothetical protein
MTEFTGIKGSRLDHFIVANIVNRQVKTFEAMDPNTMVPKADPAYIKAVLEMYAIMLKGPKYDRKAVLAILRNLPYSLGGIYVIPNKELVVELGIGATHADYKDMIEGDDTIAEIIVARPKGLKDSGAWTDVMLLMKKIAKEIKTNNPDVVMDYIDAKYDQFPGGVVTCIGWGSHSCGNIVYRKELYHGYRCPECTRAFSAARSKKGGGTTIAMVKAAVLRKKIRL